MCDRRVWGWKEEAVGQFLKYWCVCVCVWGGCISRSKTCRINVDSHHTVPTGSTLLKANITFLRKITLYYVKCLFQVITVQFFWQHIVFPPFFIIIYFLFYFFLPNHLPRPRYWTYEDALGMDDLLGQ